MCKCRSLNLGSNDVSKAHKTSAIPVGTVATERDPEARELKLSSLIFPFLTNINCLAHKHIKATEASPTDS